MMKDLLLEIEKARIPQTCLNSEIKEFYNRISNNEIKHIRKGVYLSMTSSTVSQKKKILEDMDLRYQHHLKLKPSRFSYRRQIQDEKEENYNEMCRKLWQFEKYKKEVLQNLSEINSEKKSGSGANSTQDDNNKNLSQKSDDISLF